MANFKNEIEPLPHLTARSDFLTFFLFQGYSAHLASTIMEWVLAGSFLSYFLTFIRDFQVISIRAETHLHHTTLYHVGGDQLREEEQGGENLT